MAEETLKIRGTILPGPLLLAPYVTDARCVVWAAGKPRDDEARSSGAVQFLIRADDGSELLIQPGGSAAMVPMRMRVDFDRDGGSGMVLVGGVPMKVKSRISEARVVGWLAVGDKVRIEAASIASDGPSRGIRTVRPRVIWAEDDANGLRVRALEMTEAEIT